MFFDFFVSLFYNEEIAFVAAVFGSGLTILYLLGFFFSLIHYKTRFKKLGAILWSLLMILTLGLVVWFICNARILEFFGPNVVELGSFVAMVPLYLASGVMGRFFNRKKILHWLVFPVLYGLAFLQGAAFWWSIEVTFNGQYTEESLSEETIAKWIGYDFEIQSHIFSSYEDILLRVIGKGDSVYYQVKYNLCPFVLDNKDWLQYTEPLEEITTPMTLLDQEKTAIALRLKETMMTYEPEFSGAGDKPGCFNLEINDFRKRIRHFGLFCGYGKWHKPKAFAMKKMKDSLWPSRETYTKYSKEQAERACRDSQNFTGELGD